MPKENINCIAMDGLRVEVGWQADRHVQVATTYTHSKLTLDDEPFNGWHATLDREGINRLIRSLRKARDAAFGADA